MGIEPTCSAWKADVLPLNYTRILSTRHLHLFIILVEGGGFEPPKDEPSDLQSDPFGHSGTPPKMQAAYSDDLVNTCQHNSDTNP